VTDARRVYYDHEGPYRKIKARGGTGWDDLVPSTDSYDALDAFLKSALAPAGGRALDLGCGGGQATLRLARRGFVATGIDFSETAIELARKNATGLPVTFLVGDCLSLLGTDDGSMDLVVDNHALHCIIGVEDRRAFLQSARRVLRQGGLFFTDTMSCEGTFDPAARGIDPVTRIDKHRTRFWVSAAELRAELVGAGLEVVDFQVRPDEGSYMLTVVARA
jgi:SAM-dependent methyltransferase